jgi:hypothetical protein
MNRFRVVALRVATGTSTLSADSSKLTHPTDSMMRGTENQEVENRKRLGIIKLNEQRWYRVCVCRQARQHTPGARLVVAVAAAQPPQLTVTVSHRKLPATIGRLAAAPTVTPLEPGPVVTV